MMRKLLHIGVIDNIFVVISPNITNELQLQVAINLQEKNILNERDRRLL